MAGSRAMSAREPGQVRKEAALSGHRQAQRGRPIRSSRAANAPGEPASREGARSIFRGRAGDSPARARRIRGWRDARRVRDDARVTASQVVERVEDAGRPPRALPVVRQRRHDPGEGVRPARARAAARARHRAHRGDAGDERAWTSCSPWRGSGRSASSGWCPTWTRSGCCRTRRTSGALLTDHIGLDGEPAAVCQRSFLKRMEARLRGARARAAGGVRERVLARAPRRRRLRAGRPRPVLLDDRHDRVAGLRRRAGRARSRRSGIPVEQYYAELGHGQQELSTGHAPALRAADDQVLVRETIRGVATPAGARRLARAQAVARGRRQRRPRALLAVGGRRGTGSTTRAGPTACRRRRARSSPACSSTCPGLCGLTAPSFNSYHRIAPGTWAGAFTCWGYDNREAPVRVPSPFRGAEEASTNAELKACDASCNPYLALGGLIAAGLDGLERGLELPEPVDVDPATLPADERARREIAALPATQARGARRARRRRRAHRRARRRADRRLPRRPPLRVGGLLRRRRGIRAAGSFREVLSAIPLVDHHAHGILRAPPRDARRVPRACSPRAATRASGRTSPPR